jgi:uncharacterized membrane protein YeaQ/YmgE (transglycosylase-associated protein family)
MVLLSLSLQPGNVIAWIFVGLIAGAIAGRLAVGRGFGCLGDIVLGLVGALVGGLVISSFVSGKPVEGFLGTTGVAIAGAVILLVGIRVLRDLA